jgi:hypothetical protein
MADNCRLFDIISLDLGNNNLLGMLQAFEGKALNSMCPNYKDSCPYKLAIKKCKWTSNIFVRKLEYMHRQNDDNYYKKFKEISNVKTIIKAIGVNTLAINSILDINKYLSTISNYSAIIFTLEEVGDLGKGPIIDYVTHYIFVQGKLIELLDNLTEILPKTIYDEFSRVNIKDFANEMYESENTFEKIKLLEKSSELLSDSETPNLQYISKKWMYN